MICQSFPLLCVFCIIVSTWLSYYLWFVSLFPFSVSFVSLWALDFPTTYDLSVFFPSVSFVSLWALGFPTTYDLSVFSPSLCLLYHCEHLAFLLPMICQSFPLLCVFCIIVSTWLSYYLWFVSLFPSVSFVSLWALGFPTTYDLSVFSPSLCLLYHCEHLTLLLHMICQSFSLLCVFCIIVSTWLSYYLWFVSLFPSSVSFVSLWALGFPTTYDLSVFSPPLCLLYHCEHLAFLLPMICQYFPLLCVFCIIVSTWLSYYLWFVSLFPSVSFVSLWALGFPTTYDLSIFSPPLCLLYHCEHLLPMICQSFPLLCVFCSFPTTYDLSVFSPLCLLYHCEHLAFLLPMICQSFPLLCVFCIIVSTLLSYYLGFVSLFPFSVSFVSLWALGFPTTYDLSVFSPSLCLLYHCEHLAFLLPMICQSFPLLCVFCIIVSTWLSYYLWFVSLFPSVSFVSLWALGFPTTYDLSVFSPSLCLLYHCEHLTLLLLCLLCLSYYLWFVSLFPSSVSFVSLWALLYHCVFCIIVSTWLSYYLWFVSLFPSSVSFVSLWALDFPTTYDLSVFSPPLCLLYHCEHLATYDPTTYDLSVFPTQYFLLCVFCIIVSTWLSYYLWFVSLFPSSCTWLLLLIICQSFPSVSFVSLWALVYMICQSFPLCVFCILLPIWFVSLFPSLCLLYHCEHLTFLLPMICQSFPLCVFCIIVSTWLSYYLWFVSLFPSSVSFVSLWALGFPTTYDLSVFSPLCVFCIIVSTWLSYYLWFVSLFPSSVSFVSLWALDFPPQLPMICQSFSVSKVSLWALGFPTTLCQSFPLSVSFVSLWALGFPTTYDLSVFSPQSFVSLWALGFLLPVFCIIVSTWLSYYLWFVSLFPFPTTCLLYHCEHLTFLLPMICQSFPLCVFCIIVSTWLSYYLWFVSLFPFSVLIVMILSYYLGFVSLFPFSVSFVSLWALGFPTTYDLSVFSPPLCLLYHCEHLAFLLPMICQSFPLLCVFCIIVSTWLSYYLWFVSLFPSSVSFVSLWALGFPTTYDLSVFSPPLCLLYHCEHLTFLLPMICQSFPLCVFCIIVSTWLSYYLWFVSLFLPYDLSIFSPPLCLLYHCVFCIIVSTWLSYYLWFVSLFPSVSFVSLWALGFPTTYDLSVFSPPLCLLYHCEHLAFLLPMICQSFPLLCVFCIIVSTWLSYYLWFVSLFPFSVSFVSLWALGFPTTYDLSVFSPSLCLLYHCEHLAFLLPILSVFSPPLCLLYHCEHLAFLLPMICQSFPLLCVFCIIVSTWLSYYLWFVSHCEHFSYLLCVFCIIVSTWLSYYLWFVSLFPSSVSFVSLWALGFPTTYDLSVFSPPLCLLYHCEHLAFLLHDLSVASSVSFVSLWALDFPTTYDFDS